MAASKARKSCATDEDEGLLVRLLDRWRVTRSPRLADAVGRLGQRVDDGLPKKLAAIGRTGQLSACVSRMKSVHDLEDDPRLTVAIFGWLDAARWSGSGAADGWTHLFSRLVALADPRVVAPLRASRARRPASSDSSTSRGSSSKRRRPQTPSSTPPVKPAHRPLTTRSSRRSKLDSTSRPPTSSPGSGAALPRARSRSCSESSPRQTMTTSAGWPPTRSSKPATPGASSSSSSFGSRRGARRRQNATAPRRSWRSTPPRSVVRSRRSRRRTAADPERPT
jgi:hypothetical protein